MTDEQLRALVRDAVARHLGPVHGPQHAHTHGTPHARMLHVQQHASHGRYALARTGDAGGDASGDAGDGACLIEPAVRCNHCGYCQSHGH